MHLAFLTPEYPHAHSTASGGLGTSIKNLAEQLVKRILESPGVIHAHIETRPPGVLDSYYEVLNLFTTKPQKSSGIGSLLILE